MPLWVRLRLEEELTVATVQVGESKDIGLAAERGGERAADVGSSSASIVAIVTVVTVVAVITTVVTTVAAIVAIVSRVDIVALGDSSARGEADKSGNGEDGETHFCS